MAAEKEMKAEELIDRLKEELKKEKDIQPPVWSRFAKSGPHRERPPQQKDFWYIRSASVLKRIYVDGPIGVSKLRTFYGGRKRRGYKPARFKKSSGNIIRKVLQQLEKAGLIQKVKGGRKITPKGQKLLNNVGREAKK